MKRKSFLMFLLAAVLGITSLIGCTPKENAGQETSGEENSKEEVELLVSAAASLTDVLEELKEIYKEIHPETTLLFTFGGSGALQAQIEEGAPVDVFMSAAEKQMDELEEGNQLLDGSRKTLLVNKVVLIAPPK